MSPKRTDVNTDDLIKLYSQGMSIKALSDKFNIARTGITSRFKTAGVPIRGRSDAMHLRMAQTSPEERKRLASFANNALRGSNQPEQGCIKRAKGVEKSGSKIGKGEELLQKWLTDLGLEPIPQLAVNRYNIDLAVHPIAVELLCNSASPIHRKSDRKKIEYLTNHGWSVLYIWVGRDGIFDNRCASYVRTYFDTVKRDPSLIGEYRVVRGSGEFYASGRGKLD